MKMTACFPWFRLLDLDDVCTNIQNAVTEGRGEGFVCLFVFVFVCLLFVCLFVFVLPPQFYCLLLSRKSLGLIFFMKC